MSTSTVGVHPQRARDHVAHRVDRGLVGGEAPVVDELLHAAVVGGQLAELTVAQQVRARVADVSDDERAAGRHRPRGERRAHPAEVLVRQRLREDGLVRFLDGLAQRPSAAKRGAQRLERGRARHLARTVATDPVRHRDEPERLVDEVTVLVHLAHLTDVGGRAHLESHGVLTSAHRLGDGASELHAITTAEALRAAHRLAVEQRPVPRAEILDVHVAAATEDARVDLRHERVVEHDAAAAPATHGELVGEHERLAAPRGRLQDAQARRSTAAAGRFLRGRGRRPRRGWGRSRSGARSSAMTTRTTRYRNR